MIMNMRIKTRRSVASRLLMVGVTLAMTSLAGRTQTCTVNWTNQHQQIDGFGASSAWQSTWSTAQADMFFSTNKGCGFSMIRNHIAYAGSALASATPTTVETSIMSMAQARGALVWSAPWTPAVGFKSTNDIYDGNHAGGGGVNGGSYLGGDATNQAYASQLANYVVSMKNQSINLYAISIQNEPDANVTGYEACQWSQASVHDFVTNLYNALVAKGVGSTKIILPESQNWSDPKPLAASALSDPNVLPYVGIVADHNYVPNNLVGDLTTPAPLYPASGKHTWETEVSQIGPGGGGNTYDGSITNGVYWGWRIHLFMTAAQANGWLYWWLIPSAANTDNEGLTDTSGNPAKRMYVLGQWARFVRPGYYRIDTSSTGGSAFISAFNDTNSGLFAIIAVNTNASTAINQTFNLNNFPYVTNVTPWITSATMSLSNQPPIAVSGSAFSYTVPARSVVTFVGRTVPFTSIPPTLTPVAAQTMDAGQTLLVTNTATDPNVPPQTLTFNLLTGPAGATLTPLDATDAQLSWRAPISSAGTTNPVTVAVTDNGTLLSATNSYNVIVNPLSSQPAVSSIASAGGQVTLVVSGPQGPDYTLLSTTNLSAPSWQVVLTTNSPVIPVTLVDTNSNDPERFYQIQIGP
jgi:glucuronoarabinoxylan endo-1,4-beta-xylanase